MNETSMLAELMFLEGCVREEQMKLARGDGSQRLMDQWMRRIHVLSKLLWRMATVG